MERLSRNGFIIVELWNKIWPIYDYIGQIYEKGCES